MADDGLSDTVEIHLEVQEMCDQLKEVLLEKLNCTSFTEYSALQYRTEFMPQEGWNYFVKVKIEEDEFVHLRIHKPLAKLKKKPSLQGVRYPKGKDAPIDFIRADQ